MPADNRTLTSPPYRPWLHRFTVVWAGATLLLLAAGGQVKSHEAGLSVPDWPTTFGRNMLTFPPSQWVGNIFYEHTHRLAATTVGLLTIAMTIWQARREHRRWMRVLGFVALAAVIAQGVLGGITVLYLLPMAVSVAHACLAQSFFCLTVCMALFTSRGWLNRGPSIMQTGRLNARVVAPACALVFFAQLVVGALTRHSGSGDAVPDFPRAYGQWLPAVDQTAVDRYNETRRWDMGLHVIERQQLLIHLMHRAGAVAATLAAAMLLAVAFRKSSRRAGLGGPGMALLTLLLLQWTLGAVTVLTYRVPLIATAHLVVGALLLATCALMVARSIRNLGPIEPATIVVNGRISAPAV